MAAPNSFTLVLRSAPIPSAFVERVVGTKKNNDVLPGPTNIGTLPAVATVAAPAYGEGKQVALSVDAAGNLRVSARDVTVVVPISNVWANSQVDVTGTPVKFLDADTDRIGLKLCSQGSEIIFVGNDGAVTVDNGFSLGVASPESFGLDEGSALEWWAVSGGTGDLRIAEFFGAVPPATASDYSTKAVTADTSGVELVAADATRIAFKVFNESQQSIFVGKSGTAIDEMYEVLPNESVSFGLDLGAKLAWEVKVYENTSDVRVAEFVGSSGGGIAPTATDYTETHVDVTSGGVALVAANDARVNLKVFNNSQETIFVGKSGTPIADMYPIQPNGSETFGMDEGAKMEWSADITVGPGNARVLEFTR